MRITKNRLWIGALCALALFAPPSILADDEKKDDKPVTIAPTLKAKDEVKYKTTQNISVGGMEIKLEQTSQHTVKEIKDNGEIEIVIAELGGKVSFGGNDMEIPSGPPVTIIQTKHGKLLKYKPEKEESSPYLSDPTLHLLQIADQIIYPEKEIKAGDSWTTEVDNPIVKGKKVTIKTTYVGAEKAEDTPVWKVKQTVEAATDENGGKFTAEMTAMLDTKNGQMLEAEQEVKGVPGKMGGTVDWTGKTLRVKPEADKDKEKKDARN